MTVEYSHTVHSVKNFSILRLLFRWQGSFYKLIVYEFTIYVLIYSTVLLIYTFVLNPNQREFFNEFGETLANEAHYVIGPVIFCISLFMQITFRRFWAHFQLIPWPDAYAMLISTYIEGNGKKSTLMRRTLVRYSAAAIISALHCVSTQIREIFSNDLDDYVSTGFLTEREADLLENVKPSHRHNVLSVWCCRLIQRSWRECKFINDVQGYNALIVEVNEIRNRCRRLIMFEMVQTPLALIHTVILAIYSFFITAAITTTHRYESKGLYKSMLQENVDRVEEWLIALAGELITVLQFAICNGLVVATGSLLTPFGTHDNAIEVDYILKRHLNVSYKIVDDLYDQIPVLEKENFPVVRNFRSKSLGSNFYYSRYARNKRKTLSSRRYDIVDKAARRNADKLRRRSVYMTDFISTNTSTRTRTNSFKAALRIFTTHSSDQTTPKHYDDIHYLL